MDTLFALRLAEEQSLQRTIVRFVRGLLAAERKLDEPSAGGRPERIPAGER